MNIWHDAELSSVFVDTSAYYALVDRRSSDHQNAQTIARHLVRDNRVLVTTNFVVAESHALLLNRLNRRIALEFLESVERTGTTLVRIGQRDEFRARDIIVQYDDKEFTLTDATSFAIMERLRIVHAFTFDHHFAQYGFRLIDP